MIFMKIYKQQINVKYERLQYEFASDQIKNKRYKRLGKD